MLRVVSVFTGLSGLPGYCNMFFAGNTAEQAEEVSDRVLAWWGALQLSTSNLLTTTIEPEVASINPANGALLEFFNTGGASVTGTGTGEALPTSTQLLVRLKTNTIRNNRLIRGRFNIPGQTTITVNDGRPSGSIVTGVTTAAETLRIDNDTPLGVWSRPSPGGNNGQFALAQSASCWEQFAVLTSRRD